MTLWRRIRRYGAARLKWLAGSGSSDSAPTDKYIFQQPLLIQRAHAQSVPITYNPGGGAVTVTGNELVFNGSGSPIGAYTCGSTTTMLCALSHRKWVNVGGDWVGSGGVSQSATPFSSSSSIASGTAAGTVDIDVTAACQYIWSNQKHCAFFLKSTGGNVPINGALGPYTKSTLDVTFSDASSDTYELWVANSLINDHTTDAQDDTASVFQSGFPAIVEFYDSGSPSTRISANGKTVTAATLHLRHQATAGGAAVVQVFVVNPNIPSDLTPVPGIAADYPLDSGIYSHSSVLAALRVVDGDTSADVLDEARCASADGAPWNSGSATTGFRGEVSFDPNFWVTGWVGGDGSNAVQPWGSDVTKPSAATIATLFPDRVQTADSTKLVGFVTRQTGGMAQDGLRVIDSDDASAIARGFSPLAPGLGAIEWYMGGGDALMGQSFRSNETAQNNFDLDMYFKRARIGKVVDGYCRMYLLLGEGYDAGETDFRANYLYSNLGVYPEDNGLSRDAQSWFWTNRQGKFPGGMHQVSGGTVTPPTYYYDFSDHDRSSGNTQVVDNAGAGYSNTSDALGYQGRWLFSQGYPVASHPGPMRGGLVMGLEFYDFSGGGTLTIPSQYDSKMSGWDGSWEAYSSANNGMGHIQPRKWYCIEMRWKMNTLLRQTITFSPAPSLGDTTGTLDTAWTGPTVKLPTFFSNKAQRFVQFNNGSTSVSWSGALDSAASATANTYPLPAVNTDYREGGHNVDGKLQWWIDGVFAGETPLFAHRTSYAIVDWALQAAQGKPINTGTSYRGMSNVTADEFMGAVSAQFCWYYGGNSRNDSDKYHYTNGHVLAESYIGPMAGVSRANGGLGVASGTNTSSVKSEAATILDFTSKMRRLTRVVSESASISDSMLSSASPTWYQGLTDGQWGSITGSNIDASGVLEGALGNESGAEKLFDSYSGGGLITTNGYFYDGTTRYDGPAYLLLFGGHGQNDLNALYALPLMQNVPRYKKPRDSTIPPLDSTGQSGITYVPFDGSGNPNAFQTYAANVYHPGSNKTFWIGGSAMSQNPIDSKYILSFDHSQISPNSNVPWSHSYATIPTYGDGTMAGCDVAAYEPSSDRTWFHRHQVSAIGYYDHAANTVSEGTSKTPAWSHEGVMACDNNRGILCIVALNPLGTNSFVINFYRTNNGVSNDYYVPTTSGTAPSPAGVSQNNGGMYTPPCVVWNEDADCFVVWWGGKTLWKLSPPASGEQYAVTNAWTWTSHTASSGNTPANGPNQGVNGRFQYVKTPAVRGYILNNATTEDVQFYKVSNAAQGY